MMLFGICVGHVLLTNRWPFGARFQHGDGGATAEGTGVLCTLLPVFKVVNLYKCINIRIYIYMCVCVESSFPKQNLQNWHWHCKLICLE